MKECKECNAEIADQYEYCANCFKKQQGEASGDLISAIKELNKTISWTNSNIGIIRKILEQDPVTLRKIADKMEEKAKEEKQK